MQSSFPVTYSVYTVFFSVEVLMVNAVFFSPGMLHIQKSKEQLYFMNRGHIFMIIVFVSIIHGHLQGSLI
jgi:hypothetical protein